jgi:carbonic anhydrase
MKKLLDGIRDFHARVRPDYRERFAHLALGQAPDCLFVACSDSRVVPNLFASTDPGDLFVVRNVGNVVPPDSAGAADRGYGSAGAAVEFAIGRLGVRDIVVCGHSSCGAMAAALGDPPPDAPHLSRWLRQVRPSRDRLAHEQGIDPDLPDADRLSQAHVLQQVEHLRSYRVVRRRLDDGAIRLHAWWFDLAAAQVLSWHPSDGRFLPLVDRLEAGQESG